VAAYRSRLSGPLLDRIDLQITLPPVDLGDLAAARPTGESSAAVRARVERARAAARDRARSRARPDVVNGALGARELSEVAALDAEGHRILRSAADALGLSARAWHKVLRVARTIADLDDSDAVRASHVAEAVHYRLLDRQKPQVARAC
jgi:magnesium chelatase family protein